MSNYYKDQQKAYRKIDDILESLQVDSAFNIDRMTLHVTLLYPISPKAVKQRIELFVAANKDKYSIENGEVKRWEQ